MNESPEKNRIERRIASGITSGYDFARTLKVAEILKELGENPYQSELRLDIAEIVSNLSRTLANISDIRKADIKEIGEEIDRAILGEGKSITEIRLTEEKKHLVKDIILERLRRIVE